MDKTVLEKKKQLQRVKNRIAAFSGLEIFDFEEKYLDEIVDMECYRNKTLPEDKIRFDSNMQDIINWIIDNTPFHDESEIFLLVDSYCVHARILSRNEAYTSIWRTTHSITLISDDWRYMYEFGSDSRDEYHYLFDKYRLMD